MEKFKISERYRLELHWDKVKYGSEGVCELENAYFSGPALSIAEKIEGNTFINLDFCYQYYIIARRAYVVKLSWGDVIYDGDGNVKLGNAYLSYDEDFGALPKFKDKDYVAIDTSDHEEETHAFHLVYKSFLINENYDAYNFKM